MAILINKMSPSNKVKHITYSVRYPLIPSLLIMVNLISEIDVTISINGANKNKIINFFIEFIVLDH